MAEEILRTEGLCKRFGALEVLRGITVSIHRQEIVSVIGPSGGGKSTFLRCLNLLEQPTSGKVLFHRQEMTDRKADICRYRQKIGMVFQNFHVFPNLTVLENITLAPVLEKKLPRAQAEREAMALLQRVGLREKAGEYPRKLSGGQKQRLAIVRAMAMEPEVMLFDEPTSALDPISTSKIEDLAIELKKDYTIIIVTHNMQQAARISDRTAFFLLGEMVEYGETPQLFAKPQDERTERYITGRFG